MVGEKSKEHSKSDDFMRIDGTMDLRNVFVVALLMMFSSVSRAQSDPEYLMEVGGGVGAVNYLGDFNGNLTKNIQPGASLM